MEDFTLDLEIEKTIRTGDRLRAQVFMVTLCGSSGKSICSLPIPTTGLVAKVFDPLYWDENGGSSDPFCCMDRLYTHESHAYEAVKGLQGLEIPRYYGSYSISLPISPGSQQNREVRMILIEFINGPSMGDIWGTLVITSQVKRRRFRSKPGGG
jgi:hypothetical protein